jgi:uncharacterized membrane protein YcgQ (UPF0703/DUF1980 family)
MSMFMYFLHLGWGYFALAASFIFILLQLVYLIDFAHSWAASWVSKAEDGAGIYMIGTIFLHLFDPRPRLNRPILDRTVIFFRPDVWIRHCACRCDVRVLYQGKIPCISQFDV